jgi:hypothetical protein
MNITDQLACLKLLRQALEQGKKKEMVHFHMGLCLEEMGQYSKASEEFHFCIQKNPRNAMVMFKTFHKNRPIYIRVCVDFKWEKTMCCLKLSEPLNMIPDWWTLTYFWLIISLPKVLMCLFMNRIVYTVC